MKKQEAILELWHVSFGTITKYYWCEETMKALLELCTHGKYINRHRLELLEKYAKEMLSKEPKAEKFLSDVQRKLNKAKARREAGKQ